MNIIYLPGGPDESNAEKIDMSEYIRRGTQIDMASQKIVNCAEAAADDDVVTLRGLTAYYRRGSPLDMNRQQINNLAPGSLADDAATLGQCSNMLKAYDEALSLAFSELGKSSSSGGSSATGTALGRATGAAVNRASSTAGQYQEVAAQAGSTLLSAGGSIVSNTANVIGNAFVGQVQDLRGKFVAKPIAEHLIMTQHQIKLMADATDENDAVALRQLRAYMTSESADSKFAAARTEADARYVREAELAQKVSAQQTTVSANVNMQRNRITNLPNSPLAGDAVSYDLLLEHSVRSLYRVKEGTIRLNRQNVAIVLMATDCFAPLVLLVESNLLYAQQPFALKRGPGADALTILYFTSNRSANNFNYRFVYLILAVGNFREIEPSSEQRSTANLSPIP